LKRGFDDAHAARVAAIFFGKFDAAEFAAGFAASFFGAEACGDVLLRFLFEVMLELIAQLPFHLITAKEGAQAERQSA
jgi:hypothetical protein